MPVPVEQRTHEDRLRAVVPAPRAVWREVVAADPNALVYHTPEWVDCVCAVGGYEDATRLYETWDGRRLVLPMVRRGFLGGAVSRQASLPSGWGTGGLLSDQPLRPEDVAAVCAQLRSERSVLRTFIQPSPRTSAAWGAARMPGVKTVPRLAHVLDLGGGFDVVWRQRFRGAARTAVRKAEKSGVQVEHDTTGALLPRFEDLRRRSVERWARQQHEPMVLARWRARRQNSLAKFRAIAAAVPDSFHLYLAVHEGRTVAGILVYHRAGVMYSRGAMIKELAGPVRANYLLHCRAIANACAEGCGFYDFGESGGSAQLAQFKTRFGATPAPYREYVVERLPLTEIDRALRTGVKRIIGFREPPSPPTAGTTGPADDS
jgi:Acetyltransferase (GNAT) domain